MSVEDCSMLFVNRDANGNVTESTSNQWSLTAAVDNIYHYMLAGDTATSLIAVTKPEEFTDATEDFELDQVRSFLVAVEGEIVAVS